MPTPADAEGISDDAVDIAAAAEQNKSKPAILKRLSLGFQPGARFFDDAKTLLWGCRQRSCAL